MVEISSGKVKTTWTAPPPDGEHSMALKWAPNGREVLAGGLHRGELGLWSFDIEQNRAWQLFPSPAVLGTPSPDGSRIAIELAEEIRAMGWPAKAYGNPNSTDILLIGVDTDTDSIKVHVPDANGDLSAYRYVDSMRLYEETTNVSADAARLAVYEAIRAASRKDGWGAGQGDPHEGMRRLIAQAKGWKLNLQVCYDLRFPVWARLMAKFAATVLPPSSAAAPDTWRTRDVPASPLRYNAVRSVRNASDGSDRGR